MATILNIEKRKPSMHEIELCVKWLKKNDIKVYYDKFVGYVVVPYDPNDDYSNYSHARKWDEYTDKLFSRLHKNDKDYGTFYISYEEAVQEYAKTNKEAIINDISGS